MAYRVRAIFAVDWIPDGGAGVTLGVLQANNPGTGPSQAGGPVGNAQTMQFQQAEIVAGGDSLTGSNLSSAMSAAATDAYNSITAAQLSQMQNWLTGGT
jgi:hypothetical protein